MSVQIVHDDLTHFYNTRPGLPGDWNGRLAPSHEFVFHFNREAQNPRKTKEKLASSIKLAKGTPLRGERSSAKVYTPKAGLQTHKIPDSVIRITRHKGGLGDSGRHPAVFPVDLVSEMLTAFSDPDDLAYEPFCGSGTQLISAQKNGRSCFGMEIAPAYVDVCVKRFQNFSGQFAVLEGDGRSFDEIKAARQTSGVIRNR